MPYKGLKQIKIVIMPMDTCSSKYMYVVPTVVAYCLSLQEETVEL
jgi:hypothetical protein